MYEEMLKIQPDSFRIDWSLFLTLKYLKHEGLNLNVNN